MSELRDIRFKAERADGNCFPFPFKEFPLGEYVRVSFSRSLLVMGAEFLDCEKFHTHWKKRADASRADRNGVERIGNGVE